jgi:hypothetical protein
VWDLLRITYGITEDAVSHYFIIEIGFEVWVRIWGSRRVVDWRMHSYERGRSSGQRISPSSRHRPSGLVLDTAIWLAQT